jgi:D-sedoheptulose 7-phosphate isomerase
MKSLERIESHLRQSADVKLKLIQTGMPSILAAAEIIAQSFRGGGKLLLCGNGGSAADCQHFAAEFVGRLTKDFQRPALPALALTTDTSFITAHSNDVAFDDIFARQVEALGKSGDVLIGITTSGNSPNVLRAIAAAKKLKMKTIALTGVGGVIVDQVDVAIAVPSANTQYIQESHITIEHILCEIVERAISP